MAHPYKTTKHVPPLQTPFDFNGRRALLVDDGEAVITLTTLQDTARVAALAIEYEGEWPLVSGIKGTDIASNKLVALGERIRGKPPLQRY